MHRHALLVLLVLAACGDNQDIEATPLPHISSAGGPVLAAPVIVPIFFAGDDDMQGQIEGFLAALPGSEFWHATTSEYGVGEPTIAASIVSDDVPPTTDGDLQRWLEAHVESPPRSPHFAASPTWPRPTDNTLYVVFLPPGIQLSFGTDKSCVAFGGYHDETDHLGIVYALLPRCTPRAAPIDAITPAISHELIEAVTDPHPNTHTAFAVVDVLDIVWAFTPGGELGDMCEYISAARQRLVGNYLVQRTWSNQSAAAGHDPCVPALPQPYVSAAPALGDVVFDFGGGKATTHGVQIANGTSATIAVRLASDAPTDDWTVGIDDVASIVQHQPAELSFTQHKTTGNDGDTIFITIKHLKVGQGGGSEFVVTSKVNNVVVALWWGLVTN